VDIKAWLNEPMEPAFYPIFKFTTPGDQIIFKVDGERRSMVSKFDKAKTTFLIDIDIVAGQRTDLQTKKIVAVAPGKATIILSAGLLLIWDREKPIEGDLCQLRFVKVDPNFRDMKNFAFRFLEKAPRPSPDVQRPSNDIDDDPSDDDPDNDDVPDFSVPTKRQ
jgi:hypothetical protein